MKKKEEKPQQEERDHEASPQETAAKTPENVEETRPVGAQAGSSGFVSVQLYTMSHHPERAQHAAVQRGPETFTLQVLRRTYAAMEFQPPIPMGYEDQWIQTVATGLGRALGFSQPRTPMASKDPQEEHLSYRTWCLETSSVVLEMGVSNNQKWGPP